MADETRSGKIKKFIVNALFWAVTIGGSWKLIQMGYYPEFLTGFLYAMAGTFIASLGLNLSRRFLSDTNHGVLSLGVGGLILIALVGSFLVGAFMQLDMAWGVFAAILTNMVIGTAITLLVTDKSMDDLKNAEADSSNGSEWRFDVDEFE